MNIFSVIMAGGGGTRFWPLSRQCKPKQILNLSGHDAMINETIKRNSPVIPEQHTYIVTNKAQGDLLKRIILKEIRDDRILIEPLGRNTAACIAFAAAVISKRHGESVMCMFPSDAYVNNGEEYVQALRLACSCAMENNSFVTLGIKPSYPATGYGYIRYGEARSLEGCYHVEEFVEKPSLERAREYIRNGKYLWNSGILVCRTSVVLENIRRFLPKTYRLIEMLEQHIDGSLQEEILEKVYREMQNISIDYAILERSDDVLVIPGEFGWNDVGSWDMLGVIFPPDENGNIIKADHIGIDTKNTIVYGDKLITTIGIDNMIIVNTEDALLICPKSRAQEVKNIVELLKISGKEQYV